MRYFMFARLTVGLVLLAVLLTSNLKIDDYYKTNVPVDNSGYGELYEGAINRVISKEEGVILRAKSDEFVRFSLNKDIFEAKIIFLRYFLLFPTGCFAMFFVGKWFLIGWQSSIASICIFLALLYSFSVGQSFFIGLSFVLGALYKRWKIMREKDFKA